MLTISSIDKITEEKAYAWNIVFTLNNEPMKYTTDIIYAINRNYWVTNTFITHELTSLLEGVQCSHCKKDKVACLVLSTQHVEIMEKILNHRTFQEYVCKEMDEISIYEFPTELKINNDQQVWDDIVYENTTHKILKKQ